VRAAAHWVTAARGGRGAVREAVERILKHQGRWDALVAGFQHGGPPSTAGGTNGRGD
jgi:3-deoxy-D-manno-octulosonate 8-phosphate phosphatase (KDO 8-P phosphatase)